MHLSISNSESTVARLGSSGGFALELGMPHLGRNNLSESALLKAIGHDRWQRIEDAGAVRSALIQDEAGSRLYATFFFFEIDLPRTMPLSAFGENCTVHFDADLAHYSKVYIDGRYVLSNHRDFGIRASNVFIYQERGPSKLSMAVPVNMDFSRLTELASPPETLDLCRKAKSKGAFFEALPGDLEFYEGEREFVYAIDADRDLNGAGLIYFANFVSFLDLAERQILSSIEDPVPPALLDVRSTYARRIGYFGNAQSNDSLNVLVRARGQRVRATDGHSAMDFGFDYRIRRQSDNKEVLVSSCRKIAPIQPGSESEEWTTRWMNRNGATPEGH